MAAQPTVVVVVDDNAGFLKGVARLLAHNGIESRTFASAEALLESGSAQRQPACCSTSTSEEFRGSRSLIDARLWPGDAGRTNMRLVLFPRLSSAQLPTKPTHMIAIVTHIKLITLETAGGRD
jgi:hypothetical protein